MSPTISDVAALQARALAPYQGRPVPEPEPTQRPAPGTTSEVAHAYAPVSPALSAGGGYPSPEAAAGPHLAVGRASGALSESEPEAGGFLLPPSFSVRGRRR